MICPRKLSFLLFFQHLDFQRYQLTLTLPYSAKLETQIFLILILSVTYFQIQMSFQKNQFGKTLVSSSNLCRKDSGFSFSKLFTYDLSKQN